MNELYAQYGELMVQLEIVQSKIQAVKQKIAQGLNKKPIEKKVEPVKE